MCSDCSGGVACGDEGPDEGAWWWDEDAEPAQPMTGETVATGEKGSDVTMAREPMSAARLAEIAAQVDEYARKVWERADVEFGFGLHQLLAEVERLRAREAALMEIVRAVADGYDMGSNNAIYGVVPAQRIIEQARALLASTEPTTAE